MQDFSCEFCKNTTRQLFLIIALSTVLVMKGGEWASEIANYDAKTMYEFEPKCNILKIH